MEITLIKKSNRTFFKLCSECEALSLQSCVLSASLPACSSPLLCIFKLAQGCINADMVVLHGHLCWLSGQECVHDGVCNYTVCLCVCVQLSLSAGGWQGWAGPAGQLYRAPRCPLNPGRWGIRAGGGTAINPRTQSMWRHSGGRHITCCLPARRLPRCPPPPQRLCSLSSANCSHGNREKHCFC